MDLFEHFKKKEPESAPAEWPKAPDPDTACLLLLDRFLGNDELAVEFLQKAVGAEAVVNVSYSHPHVQPVLPVVTVAMDGLEFRCSYMPVSVPQDEMDISYAAECNLFLSLEEQEAFSNHRSFWSIVQKGGGTTLEQKRRVCWAFSLLCAAMLEQEGAIGVCRSTTGQLIGKESYLFQCKQMEGKTWEDPEYFPAPLWIWLITGMKDGEPTVETWGLKEFGLPELGFFDPSLPVRNILRYLYTMSSFQITGRQLYWNMTLIPLTPAVEVLCKQDGEKLYFIGG